VARLSIRLLGPMQVSLEGEPLPRFESDKVRALLAYLAVEADQPHRREKLAGLLWPERPERSARANLRQALSNLRLAIGDARASPPFLKVTRQALQFNAASDAWVDARALAGLLSAGASIADLEAAASLYRGNLLEGFSLPSSAPFEEWALLTREHLARQVLAALGRLVEFHAERGAYEQALQIAWRRLEMDPWGEEGHRQTMRLLVMSGRRNAALAQYRALRQTLAEELGVEPEDRTTALYREIQGSPGRPPRDRQPPHNLPALLTPFVGRKAELAALCRRLRDPGCRLVTLLGPGGSGKTHLALKACWDLVAQAEVETAEHGIYFVALAALHLAEAIVPAVAQAVGLALQAKVSPEQQLFDYLAQKQVLLVLDNLEHLMPAVDWIVALLRRAPDVRLLVTSRERLNLQAEQVFRLGGMALPDGEILADADPDEMLGYSGLALFVEGAGRVQPDFRLVAGNAADVARICRLVEGLPLGILLASTWIETMAPAEIAARLAEDLGRSLDLLAADWRDVPARQRSMRAVLAHSWRLLGQRERSILARLSTFHGGFTRAAASEVAEARRQDLKALVHKSLLRRSELGRYEMHELLRQYAAERLAQHPATARAVAARHSAHYTRAVQHWAADLKGAAAVAPAEMQTEVENARAAWLWAAGQADVETLAQMADGLCLFYEGQARYDEGETICRLAAERLAAQDRPSERVLRLLARLLAWQAAFVHHLAGPEDALALLDRCLELLDRPDLAGTATGPERALALWRRGRVLDGFDREGARQAYRQCLALYERGGDRWGAANALAALGGVAWNLGEYDRAAQRHRASLALRQAIGDKRGIAHSLMAVGVTALYQGRLAEAEALVREGCTLRQELGDLRGTADGLRHLGVTLLLLGTFADASSLLERSVAIYTELGLRFGLEVAMLGEAQVHLGHYEGGHERAQQALALARSTGYRRGIGYALLVAAEVALTREQYAEARDQAQKSCQIYAEIGQWEEHCRALAVLGYARRGLGLQPWAPAGLLDELQRAAAGGAFVPLLWGLPALALLLADGGQPERAAEAYALARGYPAVARSRWLEDVVGRRIEAAAGPPGQVPPQPEDLGAAVRQVLSWLAPPVDQ
jgi:DNA-binding SARP family transcriptional activator